MVRPIAPEARFRDVDGEAGMPLPGNYQRLTPASFGVNPIVADPRLHRMWEDAMKEAYYGDPSMPRKGAAYRRYLDALEKGVVDAAPFARWAFETVRDMFKSRIDSAVEAGETLAGSSFESIHQWNWYLRDNADHAVDPRQLSPVTKEHHEIIHENTSNGPHPAYL